MNIEKVQGSFSPPINANIGATTPLELKVHKPIINEPKVIEPANSNSTDTGQITGTRLDALAQRLIGDTNALVIEKDPNGSGFIYKSIDRETGEIIRIWPKQEIAARLESLKDFDARGILLDQSA